MDGVVGRVPITTSHPYSQQGVLITTINTPLWCLKTASVGTSSLVAEQQIKHHHSLVWPATRAIGLGVECKG